MKTQFTETKFTKQVGRIGYILRHLTKFMHSNRRVPVMLKAPVYNTVIRSVKCMEMKCVLRQRDKKHSSARDEDVSVLDVM